MLLSRLTRQGALGVADGRERLASELERAEALVIGAGAGLSTAAGLAYAGPRFERWFADLERAYGFHDMYAGGFFPYETLGAYWAFWSRSIYVNRYAPIPRLIYDALRRLAEGRDYFVITTNVDHCFQRAGFDARRLFYTQGDYGLWQCSVPCHKETYGNEETVRAMLAAQGFSFAEDGALVPPAGPPARSAPAELVPRCPVCGAPMAMNLRVDGTFVEDAGWHRARARYLDFIRAHAGERVRFLELGVGGNTPVIIKYPFWRMVAENPRARYACLNAGEAVCPAGIADRSLLIDADIDAVLSAWLPVAGS